MICLMCSVVFLVEDYGIIFVLNFSMQLPFSECWIGLQDSLVSSIIVCDGYLLIRIEIHLIIEALEFKQRF